MKSRFFTNISHEFRTPLTLILGPAEKIISESIDKNAGKQAGLIKRNANRLLDLINQLLDLSKIEAGKLKLEASRFKLALGRGAGDTASRPLRVGFGRRTINPDLSDPKRPVWIAGFDQGPAATAQHDDLWPVASVVHDTHTRIGIVGLDSIGMFHDDLLVVRRSLPPEWKLDYTVVCSTHNHSTPDLMGLWGRRRAGTVELDGQSFTAGEPRQPSRMGSPSSRKIASVTDWCCHRGSPSTCRCRR